MSQSNKHFAPPELSSSVEYWFYKHLVPPGLENEKFLVKGRGSTFLQFET